MSANITFISASAGSGKTHRITEIVQERLVRGAWRPGGLIATTFTVKAAQELRERVRRRLYSTGQPALAERLGEGLIGTVHSVCGQLLARFAFEAGISPSIEVLDEEEAAPFLSQAMETVLDLETVRKLQRLADLLGQKDAKKSEYHWKTQVRQVLSAARANDFPQDSLVAMGRQGVEELLSFLPGSFREPADSSLTPARSRHTAEVVRRAGEGELRCTVSTRGKPPAVNATQEDLDAHLAAAIRQAVQDIGGNGDETKATAAYVDLLRETHQAIEGGRLAWSDWVKVGKARPAKKSEKVAARVASVATRVESHPRLRREIADYATMIFDIACRSLAEFQRLKEERGLLDFSDLEQRALHLLQDRPEVKTALASELDLLVVDEFQDTSPIQLALFMQLAACARETIWVGDVKQAIYGFRSSDPDLIKAVVEEVKKGGRVPEPLSKSWRSTPELVGLTNALFVPAFANSLGLPAAEVELRSQRPSGRSAQPALSFLELSSGQIGKTTGKLKKLTNDGYASALAEGVVQLLTGPRTRQVHDKETRQLRDLRPGDVAILCRTNDGAERIAAALSERGLAVTLEQSGLLATPEARLGLAALRRLADPSDTLASAEIVALEAGGTSEAWLENRLEYVARRREQTGTEESTGYTSPSPAPAVAGAPVPIDRETTALREPRIEAGGPTSNASGDRWGLEGSFVHPGLIALDRARSGLNALSPSEALDAALDCANVFATVSPWGPSVTRAAQRRGNLESLRALAARYEEGCLKNHLPATVAGFLFWCDDQAAARLDAKAADEQVNAIHVSTYHAVKGLEWPVVVCTDLEAEPWPRLWEITLAPVDPTRAFDAQHPLANRRLRFWPWPFGDQETGIPLSARVEESAVGQAARRRANEEELRLLYVALTRARDQLILAVEEDHPAHWLNCLGADWLRPGTKTILLPDQTKLIAPVLTLTPPADIAPTTADPSYAWFPPSLCPTPKLPARLTPSGQPAMAGAHTGRTIEVGPRLPLAGATEEADLGDMLHAFLAAELINPNHPGRAETARSIVAGYGLTDCVSSEHLLDMADRFRLCLEREFSPTRMLVEVPIEATNKSGQRVEGIIDLLLETPQGWVLIDHKSFPGPRSKWGDKAISYSGQLSLYGEGLRSLNLRVSSLWIHFVVGGGLVEVFARGASDQ